MLEIEWDGRPIGKPGVYKSVPIHRYHELDDDKYVPLCVGYSTSSSELRTLIIKSPAHCWIASAKNPTRIEEEEKAGFTVGRAVHHLLLGQPQFAKEFVIRPATYPDKKTGEPKKWTMAADYCKQWSAAQEQTARTILSPDNVDDIKGMAISLGKHPLVVSGILRGRVERSMVFHDKDSGLWVRCRPDSIPTDSGDFADLKSSKSVGEFTDKSIRDYRYDCQGALIRMACRALGIEFSSFTLVFVESSPPYSTDVVQIATEDLDEAEQDCRVALRVMAQCLKTGDWFGPVGTQRDARTAYFSEQFRERAKFRREFLQREIGQPA